MGSNIYLTYSISILSYFGVSTHLSQLILNLHSIILIYQAKPFVAHVIYFPSKSKVSVKVRGALFEAEKTG
jgi:hypothetical protein